MIFQDIMFTYVITAKYLNIESLWESAERLNRSHIAENYLTSLELIKIFGFYII